MSEPLPLVQADGAGEFVLYTTEDGLTRIEMRAEGGTLWLSQAAIAALFQTTPQNVTQHVKAIYAEGEADEPATCKSGLQVRQEGGREVKRTVRLYSLEVILAVGYRVRSARGTQFRQWATAHLSDYLVKGFVLDDARFKAGGDSAFCVTSKAPKAPPAHKGTAVRMVSGCSAWFLRELAWLQSIISWQGSLAARNSSQAAATLAAS